MPTQEIRGVARAAASRSTLTRIESPRYISGDATAVVPWAGLALGFVWLPGGTAHAAASASTLSLKIPFRVRSTGWEGVLAPMAWTGGFSLGTSLAVASTVVAPWSFAGQGSVVPGEQAMSWGPALLAFTGSGQLSLGVVW